tara:strand:- start:17530 stop:17856 length:327 start_codon:yes stop_codon:yes gene_type:complete
MKEKLKLVRLSSGEEIIGKVKMNTFNEDYKEFYPASITLRDGVCLVAAEEGRLGFIPYLPYTKAHEGVTINMQHILFIVDPADEVKDKVQEMTSGIVRADASILTGVK